MVEVVEDFESLKDHSAYVRQVLYRVDEAERGRYRIRVRAGRFGYDKILEKDEAEEVLSWLRMVGAIKVIGTVSDDVFFA